MLYPTLIRIHAEVAEGFAGQAFAGFAAA